MTIVRRSLLFAVSSLLLAGGAPAQNLIQNGTFTSNLAFWNLEPGANASWNIADAAGSKSSGSILIVNNSNDANHDVEVSQCRAATGGQIYDIFAKYRIEGGQPRTGSADIVLYFHSTNDCTATFLSTAASTAFPPIADEWGALENLGYGNPEFPAVAPAGTNSVKVALRVRKTEPGSALQISFDDVQLLKGQPVTFTIPASASITGQNGTFFQTDLWMTPLFSTSRSGARLFARQRCFAGQNCVPNWRAMPASTRSANRFGDVVGGFFGSPGTAGAIELTWDGAIGSFAAFSRTYSPSLPAPTSGTGIPALPSTEARTRGLLLGLATSGGDLTKGFRTNAGFFNPGGEPARVTLTLFGPDGQAIGNPVVRDLAPGEPLQVNDIFGAAGAGTKATAAAFAIVSSTVPVFSYATVIDNQSADSYFVSGVTAPGL